MICAGCREQPHTDADCEDTQRGCDYRGCGCQHRTAGTASTAVVGTVGDEESSEPGDETADATG